MSASLAIRYPVTARHSRTGEHLGSFMTEQQILESMGIDVTDTTGGVDYTDADGNRITAEYLPFVTVNGRTDGERVELAYPVAAAVERTGEDLGSCPDERRLMESLAIDETDMLDAVRYTDANGRIVLFGGGLRVSPTVQPPPRRGPRP